jgi:hypothetical protein
MKHWSWVEYGIAMTCGALILGAGISILLTLAGR